METMKFTDIDELIKNNANPIKGGKGDSLDLNKIPIQEINKGVQTEFEHSPNPAVALDIVKDHEEEAINDLSGKPDYYKNLVNMEDKMKESSYVEQINKYPVIKNNKKPNKPTSVDIPKDSYKNNSNKKEKEKQYNDNKFEDMLDKHTREFIASERNNMEFTDKDIEIMAQMYIEEMSKEAGLAVPFNDIKDRARQLVLSYFRVGAFGPDFDTLVREYLTAELNGIAQKGIGDNKIKDVKKPEIKNMVFQAFVSDFLFKGDTQLQKSPEIQSDPNKFEQYKTFIQTGYTTNFNTIYNEIANAMVIPAV